MADATVAIDGLETLQVGGDLAAEVALDHPFVLRDDVEDLVELLLSEVLGPHGGIEAGLLDDSGRHGRPDAVDVAERVRDLLLRWNFYTEEAWHGFVWELDF